MRQIKAKIIYNKRVGPGYFALALDALKIARAAAPGQFIHARLADKNDPLLRRPFSIHKVKPHLEILYEVKGRGTEILSKKKKGDFLDIIGPLGNGFNYQLPITNYQKIILVAGGMGVAPLIFLAEKLVEIKNKKSKVKSIVLIGSRSKEKIICKKEFEELDSKVQIATEDGSLGRKGLVTDLLKESLRTTNSTLRTIYACGPKPMLAEVARIARRYRIPAQASLEEFMGCGIGACLGCVIKTKSGYKRVCKDGPVFDANEIEWKDI